MCAVVDERVQALEEAENDLERVLPTLLDVPRPDDDQAGTGQDLGASPNMTPQNRRSVGRAEREGARRDGSRRAPRVLWAPRPGDAGSVACAVPASGTPSAWLSDYFAWAARCVAVKE